VFRTVLILDLLGEERGLFSSISFTDILELKVGSQNFIHMLIIYDKIKYELRMILRSASSTCSTGQTISWYFRGDCSSSYAPDLTSAVFNGPCLTFDFNTYVLFMRMFSLSSLFHSRVPLPFTKIYKMDGLYNKCIKMIF
jgi:hypothetical protein